MHRNFSLSLTKLFAKRNCVTPSSTNISPSLENEKVGKASYFQSTCFPSWLKSAHKSEALQIAWNRFACDVNGIAAVLHVATLLDDISARVSTNQRNTLDSKHCLSGYAYQNSLTDTAVIWCRVLLKFFSAFKRYP